MLVKTNILTDAVLDWAVNSVAGHKPYALGYGIPPYSTDWALGGPIIDRKQIGLQYCQPGSVYAREGVNAIAHIWDAHYMTGPTALIAAMRCYVASKLGDEVDVPEELLS